MIVIIVLFAYTKQAGDKYFTGQSNKNVTYNRPEVAAVQGT
jgi:hypothetical protein